MTGNRDIASEEALKFMHEAYPDSVFTDEEIKGIIRACLRDREGWAGARAAPPRPYPHDYRWGSRTDAREVAESAMRFERVEIENWGPYRGHHEIDLHATAQSPIVLIFGENGKGKTWFAKAIVWCLFGKTSKVDSRQFANWTMVQDGASSQSRSKSSSRSTLLLTGMTWLPRDRDLRRPPSN